MVTGEFSEGRKLMFCSDFVMKSAKAFMVILLFPCIWTLRVSTAAPRVELSRASRQGEVEKEIQMQNPRSTVLLWKML